MQCFNLPILDLKNQDATAWVQDHEIRLTPLRADRHIEPDQIIVLEFFLDALGEALFASGHARKTGAPSRDHCCHVDSLCGSSARFPATSMPTRRVFVTAAQSGQR